MRVPRDPDRRLIVFARKMRRSSTDAERKIWWLLRDRRLAGFKFRRQVPVGGYIIDFYCVRAKLGVELDGGQHGEATAAQYDELRTKRLAELGAKIIRFWDCDVLKHSDAVWQMIYREALTRTAAAEHRSAPATSPLDMLGEATDRIAPIGTPSSGTPGDGRGEGTTQESGKRDR